jgi:hypothetical protein
MSNEQSIKLYTQEQVKLMIDDAHNGVDGYYDILKNHNPIEFPSDEEIWDKADEEVIKLAKFYNVTDEELLTLWLSDKLLDTIENDPFAMQGLNKAKNILKTLQ